MLLHPECQDYFLLMFAPKHFALFALLIFNGNVSNQVTLMHIAETLGLVEVFTYEVLSVWDAILVEKKTKGIT